MDPELSRRPRAVPALSLEGGGDERPLEDHPRLVERDPVLDDLTHDIFQTRFQSIALLHDLTSLEKVGCSSSRFVFGRAHNIRERDGAIKSFRAPRDPEPASRAREVARNR